MSSNVLLTPTEGTDPVGGSGGKYGDPPTDTHTHHPSLTTLSSAADQ